jgi:serine/arginine repetitive matrix protein 2
VKESPVRQPDPEQLKLLWSQTSEKADVPGVNSLEGIADDLPSVPFSLQEVKSEDGETPPPTGSNGAGPSRMSLHDVTRAFQQVPPPPAGSIAGKASPQSPVVQSATSGSARHPAYPSHAQPMHSTVGGPAYQAYHPSPVLSHSPAPTLMYPHPMAPSMMGGSSAQYPQPMWIPMTAAPPGGQTPGPMRQLHSPYPGHAHPSYMSYPSPGAYAGSQPGPPGPPNGAQSRPRPAGHAGLSPNMSHSRAPAQVPMYHHQGSPVLVHPQVMHVQPSYPGTMPAGRGMPMQPSHPTPNPHAGGYTPTTHAPYVRSPWHPPGN